MVDWTPKGPTKAKDDVEELRAQLGAITDQLQQFTFAFQEQQNLLVDLQQASRNTLNAVLSQRVQNPWDNEPIPKL